jgi:hypothetical protein
MNLVQSRETVYEALFDLLQELPGIRTCTRRLKSWQDTAGEDQPAIYMQHTGEVTNPVRGQPSRIVLEVSLWIYVKSEGEDVGPILNPILDLIGSTFEPKQDGDHAMTLNGLVHHCWIEGQTQIFEGDLGEEAVAIVPIKLLVT